MTGTQKPDPISTRLERVAELARRKRGEALKTLAHHLDIDWLREAYHRTRKDGAPGVDGQSAEQYAEKLDENLQGLIDRAKSGRYRAPPVRRVHIPKGSGSETRPLGIPTFEDKVLQRAVAMLLEAVYEQDFLDCSYGFRPGRSAHQATEALQYGALISAGGWVLEVDIRKFFDSVDHAKLREVLRLRVHDGVLLRLIGKWLHAGVLEHGQLTYPERGTPQGGVISPLLANIYLHEVLDVWFERDVRPRLRGQARLIRYADDVVILFTDEDDARRVFQVLPKRFAKYGLALHPDKTRLVDFRRPDRFPPGSAGPASFDLLGFTFHWARTRSGKWSPKRKTAKDRFGRAIRQLGLWCRRTRHWPLSEQHKSLVSKLRGHFAYFGVTGNSAALMRLRRRCAQIWRKWLDRRAQRPHLTWPMMARLLERYPLPLPTIRAPATV